MSICIRRVAVFACIAGFLSATPAAHAWGLLGHRVATLLAEQRLSVEVRRAIRSLLQPGETLAEASLWADMQREIPSSAFWHYVNVPISEARYSSRYCPPQGCVVAKIGDFREVLRDPAADRDAKGVALRFLIHAIEDMHQPLHVGNRGDRGGNDLQVRFFGLGTNLHQVWDFRILERHTTSERRIFAEVDKIASTLDVSASGGNEVAWANESLLLAREAYVVPGSAMQIRPGANLGAAYADTALPVIQRRIAQAGVRVAMVLNEVFGPRR